MPPAVSFLCHFPSAFAAWDFPSVLPYGVRTFLARSQRPPAVTRPAEEIVAPISASALDAPGAERYHSPVTTEGRDMKRLWIPPAAAAVAGLVLAVVKATA